MSRKRGQGGNSFGEPFISHRLSLRRSKAWRHLPYEARHLLDILEVEHAKRGGKENGALGLTYDQFAEEGLRRRSIALAIRQCQELGFLEVTFRAAPAVADNRRSSRYRLTYLVGRSPSPDPTNEWRAITSTDLALAALARAASAKSAEHVRRARDATHPRTVDVDI